MQVVTSNEDMIAEAVRDGTLKGLGWKPEVFAKSQLSLERLCEFFWVHGGQAAEVCITS